MTSLVSTSPWDPTDVVGEWADVGVLGVDAAVARARAQATAWAATTALERAEVLRRSADRVEARTDQLVSIVVREVGKPIREAAAEVGRAVAILRYYAGAALDADGETYPSADVRSWLMTRHRPRGVVALVTPWNFPVAIPIWKLAPAIAWGNVAVLKPAREALATAMAMMEALDLPDGTLQVLATATDGARALTRHADIDAVSFTGSAAVGHEVAMAAAKMGIPAQAELGGSNPALVLADADVMAAASAITGAAMAFAGQKCTSTRRVIIVGDPGAFRDALVAAVSTLAVGDPADPGTLVGPVISESARHHIRQTVAAAVARGSHPLLGGTDVLGRGLLTTPTVLDDVGADDWLAREELFGPVLSLFRAADVDEAIELANATRYGLVASVHTRDLDAAMRVVGRIEAGMIRVNAPTTGVDFYAPFGGDKGSSLGPREQGRAAREFYTSTATITVSPTV